MPRLNIERQKELEPERIAHARKEIEALGYKIFFSSWNALHFTFKDETVVIYPYSGWHTGKSIVDGRGLQKLINQIK